jgi:uncharacterized protein YrrD
MRKGKNVVGQAVISRYDGKKIDTVKDVLLGETNENIVALLVDEGGLLSSSRVVPIEAVEAFGNDAIVVTGTDAVISASADPEVKAIVNRNEKLLGKRVLTNTGDRKGTISDMYFEEGTGRILGFEVSGGMLGDMARGTSYLAVDEIENMGSDVIFVRPETGEDLDNQVGGVQGALQDAGTKTREGLSDAGKNLREGAGQLGQDAQAGMSQREPEKALIGRRSGMDVTDENGSIIVANGQRIRAEHVEWGRETNNVGILTRAATAGTASETGDRAGAGLEAAGDNVGAMWDRFTNRLSQMRDEQGKQADEQQTRMRLAQIADAIGRPVGKVILDRSDNVILDFGDIITHQAVQKAYDANMLDTLLTSVYRAEFNLTLDQLKANQRGSATVEQATGGAGLVDELESKVRETEQERAERQERERMEAQQAAEQRERERQERARTREQADKERQREIEEARASAERESAKSGSSDTRGASAGTTGSSSPASTPGATRVDPDAAASRGGQPQSAPTTGDRPATPPRR